MDDKLKAILRVVTRYVRSGVKRVGSGIRRVGAIFFRDRVSGRTIFAGSGTKICRAFQRNKGPELWVQKIGSAMEKKNIPRDDPAILVQFLTKVT